jgi:hypothetical protein
MRGVGVWSFLIRKGGEGGRHTLIHNRLSQVEPKPRQQKMRQVATLNPEYSNTSAPFPSFFVSRLYIYYAKRGTKLGILVPETDESATIELLVDRCYHLTYGLLNSLVIIVREKLSTLYHVCIMQSSQPCPTTHAGGRTLFK